MDYLLIDVTLHISLEYRNTKKAISKAGMDIERIALPNFGSRHLPSSGRRGSDSASLGIPSRKFYHLILLLVFSLLNLSNGLGVFLGRRTNCL